MTYARIEKRKDRKEAHGLLHHSLFIFKAALFLGALLSFVFFISHFKISERFPIKTVHVYGLANIKQEEVKDVVMPLVSRGFFGVKVDFIRDQILQQPWAADVLVQRQWPDEVDVTVVERKAVARFSDNSLLSDSGVLFSPKKTHADIKSLPLFVGPLGEHILMLNYFNEMNRLLKPLHAKISYLELTPYLSWKLRLDNGVLIQVGHADVMKRLQQMITVYPKIIGAYAKDVDSIDLRYSNGVAVKWKTPVKV